MNILILNWKDIRHPQVGGAEIILYELAKRLVAAGHQVTWFCRGFAAGSSQEEIDGIKIVRRGNLVTMYLLAPLYYWSLPVKPDIILDVSNTIFWQTPLWAWQSQKIAYLNQLAREVFNYEFPPLVSRFGLLIERLQYLTYRTVRFLCYSPSTQADLVSMGIPIRNISVFPLGIDHGRYRPGKKSTAPLFICVNRLVKMKRTNLVILAMAEIYVKYPQARLIIVGTGYARRSLQELRDSLGLQKVVSFADENTWFFSKNSKDVKLKLMQQAWALVFPSVKEGWGMTVTECAACGTPAIVTNVSGLRDSVIADQTGLVVSSHPAPSELAAAMTRLISDPPLLRRLSRNALRYSAQFTWENSFSRFSKSFSSKLT